MTNSREELPEPQHEYGYPVSQLAALWPAETYFAFGVWMNGQTMLWDEDNGEAVVFKDDVRRFWEAHRVGKVARVDD